MADYVFELLTEEIPAWMLDARLAQLRERLEGFLREFSGTDAGEQAIVAGATSRRIWFALTGIPERQEDRTEEVKGPPLAAVRRPDGTSTPALEGFLRKNGVSADQVRERDGYLWATRRIAGKPIGTALQETLPSLIESMRWPKMMRWGRGEYSFIRPIHAVVSVLNGAHLPLTVFGVASGTSTKGHRTLHQGVIEIDSFASYRERLAEAAVVIDAEDRVTIMRDRARELAAGIDGTPAVDESIWEQWKYLTEAPGLVRAKFDEQHLSLPQEVLITVMRVHQKQLPVMRGEKLTSSFLAVIDQQGDPEGNARSGNAFVTNARFADARFFYETDRRRPLDSRLDDLAHLQFQEKLGDYRAKTSRIVRLALALHREAGSKIEAGSVERAATLAKCDLVTEMVKEFTDLQGQIGGIYAREEGAAEEVWQAVYDHYLPSSIEARLPRNEAGAIVSLADKLDTLAGFFSIGLRPSGSKDPFALRRAAQGVVQILLSRAGWSVAVPVDRAVDLAIDGYETTDRDQIRQHLLAFIEERVRTLLEGFPFGFSYDEIDAVLASGWMRSLHDVHERLSAVSRVRENPQFLSILDSARRIANISGGEGTTIVDSSKLEHPTEQRLASIVDLTTEQVDELLESRNYEAALDSFAALAPELEQFFNDVMVNVDDEPVRENRKALLRRTGSVVRRIADVTRIVVDRRELRDSR